MERVYVLEQTLTCAAEKFQRKFAEEAVPLLRPLSGVQALPTYSGLVVRGVAEEALDPALVVLRARYGADLKAANRRVCSADPLMEPIMDVFVRMPSRHGDKVCRDLVRRRAVVRFKIIEERGWLIRAEAPLTELLGYGADLCGMTNDAAEHWITFNRWEAIDPDDGGSGRAA